METSSLMTFVKNLEYQGLKDGGEILLFAGRGSADDATVVGNNCRCNGNNCDCNGQILKPVVPPTTETAPRQPSTGG